MNAEIERAMCQRWYSGLAGKEHAGKPATAEMAWQERARIAEEQSRELLAAARKAIMFAAFAKEQGYPVSDIYDVLDAAIESYSDEVVA
jgi:hypothetical protein